MNDSRKLLEDYAKDGSEADFRELAARYVNMVHSTALRLVNGDSHLAEDVTQTVFMNLARKAGALSGEVVLGGWLHRDACYVASTLMRGNRRRENRERQAVEMNATEDHTAANLASVAPLLDDAINELGPDDRAAILLRFFEQQEFRAVGEIMGTNEDAARMRVNRALEKLRKTLTQRGAALSAAALGAALAAGAVTAAPAGMAASVAAAALGGAAGGGATLTFIKIMSMTKIKIALASAITAAALAAPLAVQHQTIQQLRQDNDGLKQQAAQVAPLQDKLAAAAQEAANAANAPMPEAQVRELARLRNEVSQLRQQTNELAQARQQIQALAQRAATEAEAGARASEAKAMARAAASAAALKAGSMRETSAMNACINNLRMLDSAKAQWALEYRKKPTDTPAASDVQPYMGRGPAGEFPVCPDGGVYTIGAVREKPTCSIPGHVLP